MSHIWEQTITISERVVKTLLLTQFNLQVKELSLLGEGFDNVAFLINKSLVFRFVRREAGISCLENEIAILPTLANKISFPFTCPTWIGAPTKDYPYPFAGYTFLNGMPLSSQTPALINDFQFAEHLGQWLKMLHSIVPNKEHENIIKGDQSWRLNIPQRKEVLLNNIHKYKSIYEKFSIKPQSLIDTMMLFENHGFKKDKQCYLHGDLYAKHILVENQNKLTALIDWGDTHIGHPGIDLSVGIMIFAEKALDQFFKSYGGIDHNTRTIALFRAFCQAFMALPYFAEIDNDTTKSWVAIALQNAMKHAQSWRLA